MGKRSRHKSARTRGARASAIIGSDSAGPVGFNQMARKSCSECGASVEWINGDEASQRGIDLEDAMQFLGLASVPGRDVWACTRCDNYGLMGPTEMGFV